MGGTDRWVLERRWQNGTRPLPRRCALPGPAGATPLDFTARMARLCDDVARRCPELGHIDTRAVLFTFTPARNRRAYGLQARVTPMRFPDGATTRRFGRAVYQVQRYFVDGREILYLVTFCLPRFLDQPFSEKLVTVFHELYHISPQFNGDLRRHEGRYAVHTHSKKEYDARMARLARRYVAGHPDPAVFDFLTVGSAQLRRGRGVVGVRVPRPKMMPLR